MTMARVVLKNRITTGLFLIVFNGGPFVFSSETFGMVIIEIPSHQPPDFNEYGYYENFEP